MQNLFGLIIYLQWHMFTEHEQNEAIIKDNFKIQP